MEERVRPTRSGLFAIELMIAVGVFALCAAICTGLFVRSEKLSHDSADRNHAVAEARSLSECFKATGGDLEETAELAGGRLEEDRVIVNYDSEWNKLDGADNAMFRLLLWETESAQGLAGANVSVFNIRQPGDGDLVAWDVNAWETGGEVAP